MSLEYALKQRATDFVVEEATAELRGETNGGEYHYARLEKSGLTTFEALQRLAEHFQVDQVNIAAAGLKDEDAVTRQIISLRLVSPVPLYLEFGPGRWLRLSESLGTAAKPHTKGNLFGNFFWITIRNLSPKLLEGVRALAEPKGCFSQYFVNYYDKQRFGLPGSAYRTADVGAHLWAGERKQAAGILYEEAHVIKRNGADLPYDLQRLRAARENGAAWDVALKAIHPRGQAFYISSFFSRQWNKAVNQSIRESGGGVELYYDPTHPLHGHLGIAEAAVMARIPSALPLQTAVFSEHSGEVEVKTSYRPTIASAKFFIGQVDEDEEFRGRFSLTVHFFLPSGTYATAAIHQMVHRAMKHGG